VAGASRASSATTKAVFGSDRAAIEAHLEVEVRPGRASGRADLADARARDEHRADLRLDLPQVGG
jgi:hypothetical protein